MSEDSRKFPQIGKLIYDDVCQPQYRRYRKKTFRNTFVVIFDEFYNVFFRFWLQPQQPW